MAALGSCLQVVLSQAGGQQAGSDEEQALGHFDGIIKCLSSSQDGNMPNADSCPLGDLRDSAWQLMQDSIDKLDPSAYSRASVAHVMDVMAALGPQQVR